MVIASGPVCNQARAQHYDEDNPWSSEFPKKSSQASGA